MNIGRRVTIWAGMVCLTGVAIVFADEEVGNRSSQPWSFRGIADAVWRATQSPSPSAPTLSPAAYTEPTGDVPVPEVVSDYAVPVKQHETVLAVPGETLEESPAACFGPLEWICHRWQCHIKPWFYATHGVCADQFVEPPLGASVYAHLELQVANGLAAQMVLYRYDFNDPQAGDDAKILTPRGRLRLARLSEHFSETSYPIVIEASHDASLDEARRRHVRTELQKLLRSTVGSERVIAAIPAARGLRGLEALTNDVKMFRDSQANGYSTSSPINPGVSVPVAPNQ